MSEVAIVVDSKIVYLWIQLVDGGITSELVYQLKYQQDLTVVYKIIDPLQKIEGFNKIDVIIHIPPSDKNRAISLSMLSLQNTKRELVLLLRNGLPISSAVVAKTKEPLGTLRKLENIPGPLARNLLRSS